jgi:hypothetical protein
MSEIYEVKDWLSSLRMAMFGEIIKWLVYYRGFAALHSVPRIKVNVQHRVHSHPPNYRICRTEKKYEFP